MNRVAIIQAIISKQNNGHNKMKIYMLFPPWWQNIHMEQQQNENK